MTDAETLRGRAVRLLAIANRLRKRGNDQHRDLLMAKAKVLLNEADTIEDALLGSKRLESEQF